MTGDERDVLLDERAREVLDLLSARTVWPRRWFLRNPELRKNLDRLQTAVRDVQRLRRENALQEGSEEPLVQLLLAEEKASEYRADSLGLLLETVDQLLVEAGDARLVCSLLEVEYARDDAEGGGDIPTWSTLFSDRLSTSKAFADGQEPALASARHRLSMLLRARHSVYALRRARSATKATRLFWLAPALAALVAALVVLVAWAGEDARWREGVLVAVAGAVGATLAAVFKLRDALPRLGDLRTFWYTFPLQIPLGAVAGVFLWLVLESGLIEVAGDEEWAAAAVLAFAAGFSEPFLLKTLERITGAQRDDTCGEKRSRPERRG